MPIRFVVKRARRFFIYRVLSLDDTPHRIALGVAVGFFIALTPTIGFQMILTVLVAALLGANKLVGLPFAWISNPLTVIPIYGPSYWLGGRLLGGGYSWHDFHHAMWHAVVLNGNWLERTRAYWEAALKMFWPLWTGSLIIGAVVASIAYFSVYHAVVGYRRHRRRKHPELYPS